MALTLDLTNRVPSACYTKRVGVCYAVTPEAYYCSMILTANMPEEEIDEAIGYLSDGIRVAISQERKKALLDLVDALLDAKLEKATQ
jgi:hypothetical protein